MAETPRERVQIERKASVTEPSTGCSEDGRRGRRRPRWGTGEARGKVEGRE